jgi:hypothetical protein
VAVLVRTHLEHLNEGDTEVQVCLVTADQTQTEEETYGHNGAQVDFAGHGHLLSRVEDGGEAGEDLGHDGREDQMPCCEEDGEVWQRLLARSWLQLLAAAAGGCDVRNLAVSRMYLLKTMVLELRAIQVLRGVSRGAPCRAARRLARTQRRQQGERRPEHWAWAWGRQG